MLTNIKKIVIIAILLFCSPMAYSQSAREHIVILPYDLINNVHVASRTLASEKKIALISINEADIQKLIVKKQQMDSELIDVTKSWQKTYGNNVVSKVQASKFLSHYINPSNTKKTKNDTYKIQYQNEVTQLLLQIRPLSIWNFLGGLSGFVDRSYDTAYGIDAANWLKLQVDNIEHDSGRTDITIFTLKTKGTDDDGNLIKQPSIIVKIGNSNEPGIVIGAHFDTYKKYDPETSKEMCKDIQDPKMNKLCVEDFSGDKPGANDDGSGSAVLLEVSRTLIESGMQFKNPIYLVWYAAEEIGMIGSQNVVEDFQEKNIPIKAVLQLDQVGYSVKSDPTIWLVSNYVDADLTAYLADLINEYVKQPVKYTACAGPCSDHVSWNTKGIPVAFPFESEMGIGHSYPYAHSPWDTLDKLSLTHVTDYAKLAIAFSVELAEPVS